MPRAVLLFLVAFSLPLRAERVRVVVAVGLPEVSIASTQTLRTQVIESLEGAAHIERWGSGPAFEAEIDGDDVERLRRDPRVRAVTIDTGGHGALAQSVPVVGGDVAHALGYDGRGVTVAILDTGIDTTHPDFAGRVIAEQCFCDNLDGTGCCPNHATQQSGAGAATDDNGHGTHVAGIVGGAGTVAPVGLAPAVRLVAVKVMDASNQWRSFTQIYRALEWVADNRPDVRVINMSLGSFALFSSSACDNTAMAWGALPVIDTLRTRGVLITASSGNEKSITGTALPACMHDVLGIGATYDSAGDFFTPFGCSDTGAALDQVTCFTNSTDSIDLVAPGAPIVSTRKGGGVTTFYGTSMAAPHVAGAIALMLQANSTLTADAIEAILKNTGKHVTDARNHLTFPRLDIAAALAATPAPPAEGPRRRSVRH